MKSTGITRRIDDLGRIVIPKEIRRNLKIKGNEILEIFIDDGDIILKKYSSLDDMRKILEEYANLLNDITIFNVLITDRNKVIMSNDSKKYEYLNKEVTDSIQDMIMKNKTIILKNEEIIENIKVDNIFINPIQTNGDIIGSIILFGNRAIEEKDEIAVNVVSKLIINYID